MRRAHEILNRCMARMTQANAAERGQIPAENGNVIIDADEHALTQPRVRCSAVASSRSLAASRAQAQPQPHSSRRAQPAATAAAPGSSRSSAPASTSSASTPSSRPPGQSGRRSQAEDFEVLEDGKPQNRRDLPPREDVTGAPVEDAARDPDAHRRRDRRRQRGRAHLRVLPRRLSRAARQQHGARKPLVDFVAEHLGAGDLLAVMYPLTPLDAVTLTRDHQSSSARSSGSRGASSTTSRRTRPSSGYVYPAETVGFAARCAVGASRALKLGALREGRKALIV